MESKKTRPHIVGIVLGAGLGKRMKSDLPKVAHKCAGKELILWTIDSLIDCNISDIIAVISKNKLIENIVNKRSDQANIQFCVQEVPKGTGHAVLCALNEFDTLPSKELKDNSTIIIAFGDTPAVKPDTYNKLIQSHLNKNNALTAVCFRAQNPYGYGRLIIDQNDRLVGIKEEKDCTETEKKINLCNSGLLCAQYSVLKNLLPQINNNNASGEYYLTDIFKLAHDHKLNLGYYIGQNEKEFLGINTPEQLNEMEKNINSL